MLQLRIKWQILGRPILNSQRMNVVNLGVEEGEWAHKGVDDNTTLDCPGLAKPLFVLTYIVPRLYTV